MITKTIVIAGLTLAIGLGVSTLTINKDEPYVEINWEKPTTDAGWAEDVKRENFNIKKDDELESMRDAHEEKLARQVSNTEIVECPECVRFKIKNFLEKTYGMSGLELQSETERLFNEENRLYHFELEKLRQSIERMEKELELRDKGFYDK